MLYPELTVPTTLHIVYSPWSNINMMAKFLQDSGHMEPALLFCYSPNFANKIKTWKERNRREGPQQDNNTDCPRKGRHQTIIDYVCMYKLCYYIT